MRSRKKTFLAFNDFPWFSAAPVAAVFNVEPWGCEGLRWPDLGVDLRMASIQHPELYPLISQVKPVIPAIMDAAVGLHDGDKFRALLWLQSPARALGGIRLIDYQDTPEHIQTVLDLIGRIEHGILS